MKGEEYEKIIGFNYDFIIIDESAAIGASQDDISLDHTESQAVEEIESQTQHEGKVD